MRAFYSSREVHFLSAESRKQTVLWLAESCFWGKFAVKCKMLSDIEKDTLLNHLPGMAYRCSVEPPWPMEYVSPGIKYLCSYTAEDVLSGRVKWGDIVHPEDAERIASLIAEAIEADRQFCFTYRILDPELGQRWVIERGEAIYSNEEAIGLIGFIADVTDQKTNEEQLRALQTELVHLSSVAGMGTMAATIAHELNQPLAASSNYLSASARFLEEIDGGAKDQIAFGIEEARRQIRKAADIIRYMRDTISRRAVPREDVSLRDLISRVMRALEAGSTCPKFLLRTRIRPEADLLHVNALQIEQVLLNLLRNAAQAASQAEQREVILSANALNDEFAQIQIRDFGSGLAADADALLSTFGQSTTGGLGVGLSISRTIVEAHGGRIWAANNDDQGASFYLTLPRATSPHHDGGA